MKKRSILNIFIYKLTRYYKYRLLRNRFAITIKLSKTSIICLTERHGNIGKDYLVTFNIYNDLFITSSAYKSANLDIA